MNVRQSFRSILKQELRRRQRLNSRYSLRAFARFLGLSPSRLSEVMSGRHGLSPASARSISLRLGHSAPQAALFSDLVESECGRSRESREQASRRIDKLKGAGFEVATRVLALRVGKEISLWGKADYDATARFLAKHGLIPHRVPELGGMAALALATRESTESEGEGPWHREFAGLILVSDVLATIGFSIFVFTLMTDSPAVIESRKAAFETLPVLCGRIRTGGDARVDDESGGMLIRLSLGKPPRARKPRPRKATLYRYSKSADGRPVRIRVVAASSIHKKAYSPKQDSFSVRRGSGLDEFLKRVGFAPAWWEMSESRFEYFRQKGGAPGSQPGPPERRSSGSPR